MKYELINYFDVWGNAKEGWEINNMCIEERNIYIDDSSTHKEILTYLKKIGYLQTDDMRKLFVEDLGEMIEIYQRKGMMPLYSLRAVA
jgi:hypothetical protein